MGSIAPDSLAGHPTQEPCPPRDIGLLNSDGSGSTSQNASRRPRISNPPSSAIGDPSATEATHRIVAEGEETRLEIRRSSAIEGVTGSYTFDSIWATVRRILDGSGPAVA